MGRMPHKEESLAQQRRRIYRLVSAMQSPFDQHLLLRQLQEDNPVLFYELVRHHLPELLPIIYTPVVGEACQRHSDLYLRSHGLYLSLHDRDELDDIFAAVEQEVDVIVISDGERVLGLGDLGIGGMGICIGKLALYSAAGGINPARTLPLCVDVGTNNPELLEDDSYLGWQAPRVDGEPYYHFMDKVVAAIRKRWPQVVLQFEDFAGKHAANLLARYRDELCMFNDDIQGTAAVASACVLAGLQQAGSTLAETPVLIVGPARPVAALPPCWPSWRAARSGCSCLIRMAWSAWTAPGSPRPAAVRPSGGGGVPLPGRAHRAAAPRGADRSERPGRLVRRGGADGHGEVCERPVILPLSNPTRSAEATPARCGRLPAGAPCSPPAAPSRRWRWTERRGWSPSATTSMCSRVSALGPARSRRGASATACCGRRCRRWAPIRWPKAAAAPHRAGGGGGPRRGEGGGTVCPCRGLADFAGDPAPLIDQTWWRPHYWSAS